MTDLENFKPIRIQWHLALFSSHLLSASEKLLAAYLINVRLNVKTGALYPAVSRIAEDLSVDRRTVQRSINRLEHLGWIWTKRGTGRKRSNHYFITDESIEVAAQIRRQTDTENRDTDVALSIVKPWQERRAKVTPLSRKRRQECHSNTKKKNIKNDNCSQLDKGGQLACPVQVHTFHVLQSFEHQRIKEWDDWLVGQQLPKLVEIGFLGHAGGTLGYLVPRRFVPSDAEEIKKAQMYFLWAAMRIADKKTDDVALAL